MKRFAMAALFGLVVSAARPAFAEPTADDRAVARSLFDQARGFMKNGDYASATPKLEESMHLDPGVGTLFNLADCYEHQGRSASAWGAFAEAADLARRAGQEEREHVARARASALEPKLSRIRLHLATPRPDGLELRLDGKPLGLAALDTDLPIDPGEHRMRVSAPGKSPADVEVKISGAPDIARIELPALADQAAAPPPVVAPLPAMPAPAEHGSWRGPATIALGVGALVGLGVGTGFALKASGSWSDAKSGGCPNACTDAGYQSWDSARSSATVGTVGFIAGGVLAAAAVVLFVTTPRDREPGPQANAPGVWRW